MRRHGFKCNVVEISIRDNGLNSIIRQMRINQPTNITDEIVKTSFELFKKHYRWEHPITLQKGIRDSVIMINRIEEHCALAFEDGLYDITGRISVKNFHRASMREISFMKKNYIPHFNTEELEEYLAGITE